MDAKEVGSHSSSIHLVSRTAMTKYIRERMLTDNWEHRTRLLVLTMRDLCNFFVFFFFFSFLFWIFSVWD